MKECFFTITYGHIFRVLGLIAIMSGPSQEGGGLGHLVAQHYDNLPERGRKQRAESRIIHMRNFNNWIKSTLINEYIEKVKRNTDDRIKVLDVGKCSVTVSP